MVATFSSRLLSNGNWKAMVNTERLLPKDVTSLVLWFADEPTSRLEVRSSVRFVMLSCTSHSEFSVYRSHIMKEIADQDHGKCRPRIRKVPAAHMNFNKRPELRMFPTEHS